MANEAVNIVTHFLWFLLAIPATVVLWNRCRGNRPKQLSLLVYGISLCLCAAASTIYHTSSALHIDDSDVVSLATVNWLGAIDHMGIYLLIAGTTTPILFTLLRGRSRTGFLTAVWVAAALGIVARLFEGDESHWLSVVTYLLMGWGLVSTAPGLLRALPARDLRLIWIGGLLYTLGALAHALNWPTLWPNILGPHQLLHFFVLAGSATHFCFLLWYVVPYRERVVAVAPEVLAQVAKFGPAAAVATYRASANGF